MVCYFIGLGLGSKEDITLRGLGIIKRCKKVLLEHYTAIFIDTNIKDLMKFYGIEILFADRTLVEEKNEKILNFCKNIDIAFLVIGDPFCATTHSDLLLRISQKKGLKLKIIHNSSIINSIACCGLQLYQFGQTISFPLWTDIWRPSSFYFKIKKNLICRSHTLCLLDIKMKEFKKSTNSLKKKMYKLPRYMTIRDSLEQLLIIEREKKLNLINSNLLIIGLSRIGNHTEVIKSNMLKFLITEDFGPPLHSLIVVGKIHVLEEEVLRMYEFKK